MKPVVTITLNPAVDLTIEVDGFAVGGVNRAGRVQMNAGGKGVNVAGCAADWGAQVTATGVLGRGNDGAFVELFAVKGIADRFIRIAGDTRTNIKIADTACGETTDLNTPGLVVDAECLGRVTAAALAASEAGAVVVIGGSLPAGLAPDALVPLVATLHAAGARVVADTSGAPLKELLAASGHALPFAVKPNRHELEDLVGRPLPTRDALVAAARDIALRGVRLVVVSCGEDGALFVTADETLTARLPRVEALSTVGAGDAMVAGIASALAEDKPVEAIARQAVAFAAAKLARVGPHLPERAVVEALAERAEIGRL
ncbi:1-phosphofructokinase [Pleomorphomonas carboxyditropha]|uniref:Phosphofructokinase n=1 Tax=Pleomorphomonas carboxyditropha TaxID=2023338 RepID=A0A2G9WQY9_9HYPH|nr:1-phosphofructokinase [Pleomorphomonas carboxyditropha]PIO97065.1 1-phosphofructokinase [Pleomorphomonas carboxyditropha]